jgi:RNA polymerase sigma-70 factor (ECF subfamily)
MYRLRLCGKPADRSAWPSTRRRLGLWLALYLGARMAKTSSTLLERVKSPSDQAAWERFVELYAPLVYQWARRAGLDEAPARDLVQDVLLTLVEKLPQFSYDRDKSFRSWLKTVTLNKWREGLRRHRHEPAALDCGDIPDPEAPDAACLFEEAEYRRALVYRAMKLIEPDFAPTTWKACWDYAVLGRQPADVAAELGIKVHSVYLAKSRIVRRLREILDGLLD